MNTPSSLRPKINTNQRTLRRKHVHFPVSFSGDLIDGDGTVVNLSTSGCGIRTPFKIRDRSYGHVLLYLPNEEKPMKVELAAIRWTSGHALGLEFIRITNDQQRRLREFLNFLDRRPVH